MRCLSAPGHGRTRARSSCAPCEAGRDVVAIAGISPRAEDRAVVERAVGEQHVLITEDKDFGQLVLAEGARAEPRKGGWRRAGGRRLGNPVPLGR